MSNPENGKKEMAKMELNNENGGFNKGFSMPKTQANGPSANGFNSNF